MDTQSASAVDVVVIGCGSIGSMALWQLTELYPELSVLGIEQYGRVHTKGSYSGESRLFRVALKEGGIFIPLVQQARKLWLELNKKTGRDIFLPIGALSVAPRHYPSTQRTLEVIEEYALDHELLDPDELYRRFPAFSIREKTPDWGEKSGENGGHYGEDLGIFDPAGGGIRPELAVASAQQCALEQGAQIWDHTHVQEIKIQAPSREDSPSFSFEREHRVRISTDKGEVIAKKVILTCGSWISELLPDLQKEVQIKPIPLSWYMPLNIENFMPENLPVFMRDIPADNGENWHCYGAPSLDGYSVKVSHDLPQLEEVNLKKQSQCGVGYPAWQESLIHDSLITKEVEETMRVRIHSFCQGMVGDPVRLSIHHDGFREVRNPIIGHVPGWNGTLVTAAAMNGNGMKFAPIYGRAVAELAVIGGSDLVPEEFGYPT